MAIVTAILAVAPHLVDPLRPPLVVLGLRGAIRSATYLFVAAIVVSFRRSFDRERFLALRDRMTGALNKEAFNEQVAAMIEAAARAGNMLMLANLDLDNFRAVNDAHGHAAGDAVLRAIGRGATGAMRRQHMFGRIGGDEFAFLIQIHSAEEGRRLATALHERLSEILARVLI